MAWRRSRGSLAYIVMSSLFATLTAIFAQVKFNLGPIPYTMQNFVVILTGLVLKPKYAALSQLIYLLMIAFGVPAAANFSGGPQVLVGYTAGYLWMFPVSSFLMSYLSRLYARRSSRSLFNPSLRDKIVLLLLSLIAVAPMYLVGFLVFCYYAVQPTALGRSLSSWSKAAAEYLGLADTELLLVFLTTSVLVFIPQDLFVDHLLAILIAPRVLKFMRERGLEIF